MYNASSPHLAAFEPSMSLRYAHITELTQAAGLTIGIYDHLLTLNDEIRYIWCSPPSIVKYAFILNRILTPVTLAVVFSGQSGQTFISTTSCQRLIYVAGILSACITSTWNVIICMRVCALWGSGRYLRISVAIAWAIVFLATLGLVLWQNHYVAFSSVSIPFFQLCAPIFGVPEHYYIVWIPSIIFEFTMFTLAMMKLLRLSSISKSSLGKVLIRDGVLYFVVVMSTRVANLVLFIRGDAGTLYIALFLIYGLSSSMISRMVINLRRFGARRNVSAGTSDGNDHSSASKAGDHEMQDLPGPASDPSGLPPAFTRFSHRSLGKRPSRSILSRSVPSTWSSQNRLTFDSTSNPSTSSGLRHGQSASHARAGDRASSDHMPPISFTRSAVTIEERIPSSEIPQLTGEESDEDFPSSFFAPLTGASHSRQSQSRPHTPKDTYVGKLLSDWTSSGSHSPPFSPSRSHSISRVGTPWKEERNPVRRLRQSTLRRSSSDVHMSSLAGAPASQAVTPSLPSSEPLSDPTPTPLEISSLPVDIVQLDSHVEQLMRTSISSGETYQTCE